MAEVINLNRFRKAAAKAEATKQAAENRIRFGRDKQEKIRVSDERQREATDLDGKKRE